MSTVGARPSVFLSYASQDRGAARLIRDALRGYGLDVWYDESELGGGEAWDQKIRRQIRECDYFMPLVSTQTEARAEGYFRREWRLAVERTLDMADDHLFLLPVVIDDTNQSTARVPERFLAVQWLNVPGGEPTAALEAACRRIASGEPKPSPPVKPATRADARAGRAEARAARADSRAQTEAPQFPREEPGQKVKFWVDIAGWATRSVWFRFKRLPRWVRVAAYVWIAIAVVSRCGSENHEEKAEISPRKVAQLKAIAAKYQGNMNKADVINLGKEIAKEFTDEEPPAATQRSPLLAIPFTAPAGDGAGEKLANAAFAMTYGMVSISHRGQVGLTHDALASQDLGAAVERGRDVHSTYVLRGGIVSAAATRALTVDIARVADGAVVWSKSYPPNADPSKIAAEVDSHVPSLEVSAEQN